MNASGFAEILDLVAAGTPGRHRIMALFIGAGRGN